MDLVLFIDAIEHVIKVFRIITTSKGNGLLVGVGGSGRKSLASLATHIADFDLFMIEISKSYGPVEWKEDMMNMFIKGGVDERGTVFLFGDTHIVNEAFLEDVNNILNNGEIPNLFAAPEDYASVTEAMKDSVKGDIKYSNLGDPELFSLFKDRCRSNIHVMLAFSPIGEDFRRRLRMFPSIVNCTTIDWFLPWPNDALSSVAQYFLEDVDLPERDGIVKICVDMQQRVRNLTKRYYDELRKYYYVTPTSYLELIKTFKSLLEKKRLEVGGIINKFRRGLEQLKNAQEEVGRLEIELTELGPQLEQSQKETNILLIDLEKQKKIVSEKKKEVEIEEKECRGKTETSQAIETDCKEELSKVEPILKKAIRAVSDLNNGDISEIRSVASPSTGVILVIKTLCMLYDIAPDKKRGQTAKEGVQLDYWTPSKKKLLTPKLLKNCLNFNKDEMNPETIAQIKEIVESEEYSEKELIKASKAAFGLGNWVKAMVKYDEAMKIVTPKKKKLAEAQADLKEAQDAWDIARANLAEMEEQVRLLEETFTAAEEKKKKLQRDRDDCQRKLSRAGDLLEKLAGEKDSWAKLLSINEAANEHLTGDVLLSSGVIAYLGVFTHTYREDCIKNWTEMLTSFGIKSSEEFSLQAVLGNSVEIRSWQINKLPSDSFSVDNAIIQKNSDRWPLMIDPQMQANIWIKSMEAHAKIKFLKPTSDPKDVYRTLENCMLIGTPIILEDCLETIDPIYEPLLEKQIEKHGANYAIKLGDGLKEYSPDFRFYVTTKLSSPHYAPEVCVKVVMLNFMVTEDGLEDQMLSIVVKHEDPKKYEMRNQFITQEAENNKIKKELEDKILNQIAGASGNLLEDDELITTLDQSKAQYIQIERQLADMMVNIKNINAVRDQFKPVAKRVARYFFCLSDMSNIDPMYQYSLKWYSMIFQRSLELL
jgi:dynein heavy chain